VGKRKYRKRRFADCVRVSDTESWHYRIRLSACRRRGTTSVLGQWQQFGRSQPRLHSFTGPKLVSIYLQPYGSTQAPNQRDLLNIGVFTDASFKIVVAILTRIATGSWQKSRRLSCSENVPKPGMPGWDSRRLRVAIRRY